jgi:hypothetical protein
MIAAQNHSTILGPARATGICHHRDAGLRLCLAGTRDPTTFAVIALTFFCDNCVANFAESLGQERPKAPPTR